MLVKRVNPLLFFSYLIGAIPTAVIAGKLMGVRDLTQHGSGNSGATNAGRILGWPFFILVLIIDIFKAYGVLVVCAWILQYEHFSINAHSLEFYAIALLIGNGYSIFLKMKGGKGIATMIGILLYFFPLDILLFVSIIWLVLFCITRRVGVSCAGVLSIFPAIVYIYNPILYAHTFFLSLFMTIFGLWRHRSNINNYIASFYCDTFPNK